MKPNGVDKEDENEELLYAYSDHIDVKVCATLVEFGASLASRLTVQYFSPS